MPGRARIRSAAARWNQANSRCSQPVADNRVFVNRLREVLGQDVLYDEGVPTDAERFYRHDPLARDGRVAPHPNAL